MVKLSRIFAFFCVTFEALCQDKIGSPCSHIYSGTPGECKLLSDCDSVRAEVILLILPQVCGFQGTQSIVCCPINGTNGTRRKPGVISKEKCREYSQFALQNPPWDPNSRNECGHKIVKRIVGGVPTSRTEFAHMASIGFQSEPGDEITWSGGGTLISDRYVLTSATFKNIIGPKKAKYVKLGITRLSDQEQKQEFNISEFITHPDFDPSEVYNDIGLIKLDKAVALHSHARPACLYTEGSISETEAVATGWGHTRFGGQPSDQLLKVYLELVAYEACNESYINYPKGLMPHGIDNERQVCAGAAGVHWKDACQGDSGGPLQIHHTGDDIKCMYDIIGITSLKNCGSSGNPGAYTRISYYVKWIEDVIWPE